MIVVDTDVLAYFLIRDDPARTALADQVRARDREWCVPPLWVAEFRNVLTTHIRYRGLSLETALNLMDAAMACLADGEVEVTSASVLTLAEQSGCTAYDSEFAAVALASGLRLVTGDRKLASAFPGLAVTMEEFAGIR